MAGLSDIEWTDATWNPVSGCSIVSPGCSNCYAMRMAARLQAMGHKSYHGTTRKSGNRAIWTGKVTLNNHMLGVPINWKKPRMIFVNSMSDLFQEKVSKDFIKQVWDVMSDAHWHIFQILTKRPENMASMIDQLNLPLLENVWLGTSVESKEYNYRIDYLRACKAAVRFISFEPLIGSVGNPDLNNIDWAIVGGESGPRSRPMESAWIDSIKESCDDARTSFFFKQWGGINKKKTGRIYLGQTWDEMPKQLLVA